MHFDDTIPTTIDEKWSQLETRIQKLLESIIQLRTVNGQLMKENLLLKNQLQKQVSSDQESHDKMKQQYEEALSDIQKMRNYILKIENLLNEIEKSDFQPEIFS